jgi:hypothetical protein
VNYCQGDRKGRPYPVRVQCIPVLSSMVGATLAVALEARRPPPALIHKPWEGEGGCALFFCAVHEARESRATVAVAPATQACHPERSEGSRCPTHQTLRCAQGDSRGLRVTLDGMPPGA